MGHGVQKSILCGGAVLSSLGGHYHSGILTPESSTPG